VALSKVFEIAPVSGATTFADDEAIPTAQKAYINGLQKAGLLAGATHADAKGLFADASAVFTRAQLMSAFDQIAGDLLNAGGSYAAKAYAKSLMISRTGVTLKDAEIGGNLYITEGVADGDVFLNNVKVAGAIYVKGGGKASVHFSGVTAKNVVIYKPEVRIAVSGASHFGTVEFHSAAVFNAKEVTGKVADSVVISADGGAKTIELDGEFGTLTNEAVGSKVEGEAKLDKVEGQHTELAEKVTAGAVTETPATPSEPQFVPSGGSGSGSGGGSTSVEYQVAGTSRIERLAGSNACFLVFEPAAAGLPSELTAQISGAGYVTLTKVTGGQQYRAVFTAPASAALTVQKVSYVVQGGSN
jgi:hypothetical protein